ncbi:MAG: succinate dehydrogenase cytochrome b subunit [Bacteroidota bacterium]
MNQKGIFKNVVVKKYIMGLSGLFLILFLLVHLSINLCALIPDGGNTFNELAEFMDLPVIKPLEVGLFVGFIIHILDALVLTLQNRKARKNGYEVSAANANSKWYSRSMGILGTLLLMFLIIHLSHFWFPNRFTGYELDGKESHNLYQFMLYTFNELWIVILYALVQISLGYHLLHGFKSAFQTLGLNHPRYNTIIEGLGVIYSITVPLLFAVIPVILYLRIHGYIPY